MSPRSSSGKESIDTTVTGRESEKLAALINGVRKVRVAKTVGGECRYVVGDECNLSNPEEQAVNYQAPSEKAGKP